MASYLLFSDLIEQSWTLEAALRFFGKKKNPSRLVAGVLETGGQGGLPHFC